MNFWKTLFTTKDDNSGDVHRVLLAVMVVAFISYEGWVVLWKGQPFDMLTFAAASAGMLTGSAAGLRIKQSTEPG